MEYFWIVLPKMGGFLLLVLIGFLAMHAYRDVETLEHYEVPFFGRLANSFVDEE